MKRFAIPTVTQPPYLGGLMDRRALAHWTHPGDLSVISILRLFFCLFVPAISLALF